MAFNFSPDYFRYTATMNNVASIITTIRPFQYTIGKTNYRRWKKGTRGQWFFASVSATQDNDSGKWIFKFEFMFRSTYWKHYKQTDFNKIFPTELVLKGDNGNVIE